MYREVRNVIPGPPIDSQRLDDILSDHRIEMETIETGRTLARWFNNKDLSMVQFARNRVSGILAGVQREYRTDRWKKLAAEQIGLPEDARDTLQNHIDRQDDSASLYLLNYAIDQAIQPSSSTDPFRASIPSSLSEFNTHNTHYELRQRFCQLWDMTVVRASHCGTHSTPANILRDNQHHFLALYPHVDADTP